MSHVVEFLIEQFSARQEKFFAENLLANNDIFESRIDNANFPEFKYAPRYMYFYYVRLNDNGKLKVTHHEHYELDPNFPDDPIKKWKEIPRAKDKLEQLVGTLADKAREGTLDVKGFNLVGIEWQRRSYIVIIFDEPNWSLYKKNDAGTSLVFLTEKGGLLYTENHSFFDAVDLNIQTPDGACSALAIINHLKGDSAGADLKPNAGHPHPQGFQFNLFLRLQFEDGTDSPLDIIIDPGGTNQGPSLQP